MLNDANQVRKRVEANLAAVEDGTTYGGDYGRTLTQIVRETYLDNPKISEKALIAKSSYTIEEIGGELSNESREIIIKRFPDYRKHPTQILAAKIQAVFSATTPDKVEETFLEILDANPGYGLTGPGDRTPRLLVRFDSDDPRGLGTAIHDNNSIDDAINRKKFGASFVKQNSENKAIWGTSSDELSALIMFADAMADKALELITVDGEISDPSITLPVYQTVSDLGRVGASIGGKIAALTGSENLASQLITESAGETLGSWIGDAISYNLQGRTSLEVRALLYRFSGNFIPNVVATGSSALSSAFIEAFDIEDPFAQIGVNTVTSAVTTYSFNELAIAKFGEDFAVKYLGVPAKFDPNTGELVIKNGGFAANNPPISQNILNIGISQLGAFAGSELYEAMVGRWNILSEDLNAEWASYGGQIGGLAGTLGLAGSWAGPLGYLVGTGLGTLIGNIIGGTLGEIFDPDFPRAAYRVGVSSGSGKFVSEGPPVGGYEFDGGNVEFAKQMGDAATDYLNLIVGLIGGTPISADNFYYGHYEENLVYQFEDDAPGGSSWRQRVALPSAQEAVQAGVLEQLKTVQIEDGDPYMKQVLANLRDKTFPGNNIENAVNGYADVVLDFFDSGKGRLSGAHGGVTPNLNTLTNNIVSVSTDVVLGDDADEVDFLVLPKDSYITLGFTDETIIDSPGDDIFITEFFPRDEQAEVFVSSNLTDFVRIGIADGGTTTALDLASIGFTEPVRAIKIFALNDGTGTPGFELANVQVLPGSIGSITVGNILDELLTDLGVAKEYSTHKTDPILYGMTIVNLSDESIRQKLLADWRDILKRANELKLNTMAGDDGSEFLPGLAGDDQLNGDVGNDFLYGDKGNDSLNAGLGNDRIEGGDGNDSLSGEHGNDVLWGGEGKDRLLGGDGNDILVGDKGIDILTGGSGKNSFIFNSLKEGTDTITDFKVKNDLIDLRAIFSAKQFAGKSISGRFDSFVELVQAGKKTEVRIDSDGKGSRTKFVTLAILQNVSPKAIEIENFLIT